MSAILHKIARDQHTVDSGTDESTARPAPFRFPYREHRTLAQVDAAELPTPIRNPGCESTNGLATARSHPFNHAQNDKPGVI